MNILVTYFSQTGNTEKIARAIYEEAANSNNVELKKLENLSLEESSKYDFIFFGSPLHSGSLAGPVKECIELLQTGTNQKLACFITHFAPAYPGQDMDGFTEPVKTACRDKGIEYRGAFDCQGFLAESLHGPVQEKMNLSDEQWGDMVKQMTGHPSDKDINNAREFTKRVLL